MASYASVTHIATPSASFRHGKTTLISTSGVVSEEPMQPPRLPRERDYPCRCASDDTQHPGGSGRNAQDDEITRTLREPCHVAVALLPGAGPRVRSSGSDAASEQGIKPL